MATELTDLRMPNQRGYNLLYSRRIGDPVPAAEHCRSLYVFSSRLSASRLSAVRTTPTLDDVGAQDACSAGMVVIHA